MRVRLSYLERIIKAYELGLPAPHGEYSDLSIKHDHWCPLLKGDQRCTCDPDIVLTLDDGRRYQVFRNGLFSLIES